MRFILLFVSACVSITASGQSKDIVRTNDFANVSGAWKGSLTYLDDSSGKPFTTPANVNLRVAGGRQVILAYEYPNEPKANGNDTLLVGKDGLLIDGAKVAFRELMEDGAIRVVTDNEGEDGNDHKKTIVRHIYILGKNSFQMRKEVKFDGADKWIMRNEYVFSR